MFKDSIFSKNKEDVLKFELYKTKETYDLDKAILALSNERIITVEGYYKNGESVLETFFSLCFNVHLKNDSIDLPVDLKIHFD